MRLRFLSRIKESELTFSVKEGAKTGAKSAYTFTIITAFYRGKEVGSIDVGMVTPENFNKSFPTLWHFMSQEGWCFNEDCYNDPDKMWKMLSHHFLPWSKWDKLPSDESIRDKDIKDWESSEALNQKFKAYKNWVVNKPYVDFIRVSGYQDGEVNIMRQGIGLALYTYAAKWLAKQGLVLYASGCQSNKAKAVWDYMIANDYPIFEEKPKFSKVEGYKKTRIYLDYRGKV